MSKYYLLYPLVLLLTLSGCASIQPHDPIDEEVYASGSVFSYQPLNPTTVWIGDRTEDEIKQGYLDADQYSYDFNKALLRDLDTETVRISLSSFSGDGKVSAGIVGTSIKGQSYVLIVDYIKYFTSNKKIRAPYLVTNEKGEVTEKEFNGIVPIYTGIGLRIRAEFKAQQSGLNISGLPALAIAANSNGISGRLTVQTLGITGAEVTGLMPLISDISVTSIQSAVQAVAAIKAKIYEKSTTVFPKLVGFETPDSDPAVIRAIAEDLYAYEPLICPTLTVNPEDPDHPSYWIDWFCESNAAQ